MISFSSLSKIFKIYRNIRIVIDLSKLIFGFNDLFLQRITTESRNQEAKPSRRSTVAKGADSTRGKVMAAGAIDTTVDGVLQNGSPNESTTKKSNAFVIDFDDRPSKEDDAMPLKKSSMKKSSNDVRPIFFLLLKFHTF